MRFAAPALVACLAACSLTSSGSGAECRPIDNSQCGDEVCALSGECLPKANVRAVKVVWTVDGVAADPNSCSAHPDLFLQFDAQDYGDTLRIAPVPCYGGSYLGYNVPARYVRVELGVEGGATSTGRIEAGTSQALATINLFH
jgi:hypothetical protein